MITNQNNIKKIKQRNERHHESSQFSREFWPVDKRRYSNNRK